jgi:hypothetical protein
MWPQSKSLLGYRVHEVNELLFRHKASKWHLAGYISLHITAFGSRETSRSFVLNPLPYQSHVQGAPAFTFELKGRRLDRILHELTRYLPRNQDPVFGRPTLEDGELSQPILVSGVVCLLGARQIGGLRILPAVTDLSKRQHAPSRGLVAMPSPRQTHPGDYLRQ